MVAVLGAGARPPPSVSNIHDSFGPQHFKAVADRQAFSGTRAIGEPTDAALDRFQLPAREHEVVGRRRPSLGARARTRAESLRATEERGPGMMWPGPSSSGPG
jgi:hypothetical protein